MNRVVFLAGGRRAWLTWRPPSIQGGDSRALPHGGLRWAGRGGRYFHAFRHVESKVDEFQAGGSRPNLERPRCLQEQPAYTGVKRNDERDNRQSTCAFVSDCRHGRTTATNSRSKCLTDGELKALGFIGEVYGIASARVQRYAE